MKKVHIVFIENVQPHPNADNLEIVSFSYGKRTCVVPKGEFVKGQRVVRILPEMFVAHRVDGVDGLKFPWVGRFYSDCERANKHYLNRHRIVQVKCIRGVNSYGIVLALNDVREEIAANMKKLTNETLNKHFWEGGDYEVLCKCLGVSDDRYGRNILDCTWKQPPTAKLRPLRPMIEKLFPVNAGDIKVTQSSYLASLFSERYLNMMLRRIDKNREYEEKYV